MLLAGDVGGTKTLLGLFERGIPRPRPIVIHAYPTLEFASLTELLDAFARDVHQPFALDAAALGVAGPVVNNTARLTNVPWDISAASVTARFGATRVCLLNDLEAMGHSVEVLDGDEFTSLQDGVPVARASAALIAAGTGLGEALLHRVNGRLIPIPSEGGHADFGARTDREFELVRMLREQYGRASVEHVVSGRGLLNLHAFTHRGGECDRDRRGPGRREAGAHLRGGDDRTLPGLCRGAAYARCGLWRGGRKSCPARTGAGGRLRRRRRSPRRFFPCYEAGYSWMRFATRAKWRDLVARVPVRVILNPDAGLLGAAVYAQSMLD